MAAVAGAVPAGGAAAPTTTGDHRARRCSAGVRPVAARPPALEPARAFTARGTAPARPQGRPPARAVRRVATTSGPAPVRPAHAGLRGGRAGPGRGSAGPRTG